MKNLSSLLVLICIGIFTSSCEKVVDLKVAEAEKKVAVEGLVTNWKGESYVKLSYTKAYLSAESPAPVTDAVVVVSDNEGEIVTFVESSPGLYSCPPDFAGTPGVTYQLEVQYGSGAFLHASSSMPDTGSVQSLELVKAESDNPGLMGGYHLFGKIWDRPFVENFYKADIYINGNRQLFTAGDITVFDDRYFDNQEIIQGLFASWIEGMDDHMPQVGDSIAIKLYSISRNSHDYLKALSETPQQGGLFGKNPANVPSNVEGGLGLFQACSYTTSPVIIVED